MSKKQLPMGRFNVAQVFWWMVARDENTTLDLNRGLLKEIRRKKVEPLTVPISGTVRLKSGTTFSVCTVGMATQYRQCYSAVVEKFRWSAFISPTDAAALRDKMVRLVFDDPALPGKDPEKLGGRMRKALTKITVDALADEVVDAALGISSGRLPSRWEGPHACVEADFYEAMTPVVAACSRGDLIVNGVRPDAVEEEIPHNVWLRNCFHLSGTTGYVTREEPALASLLIARDSGLDAPLRAELRGTPIWRNVYLDGDRVLALWPKDAAPHFEAKTAKPDQVTGLDEMVRRLLEDDRTMSQKRVYARVVKAREAEGRQPETRTQVSTIVLKFRPEPLKRGPKGQRKKTPGQCS